jgi:NADH:ubiquinone oxidoreductase subunit F (NADH-binding)
VSDGGLALLEDPDPRRAATGPAGLPRLLSGTRGPASLEEHRRSHDLPPRSRRSADDGLLALVERSGLRGRGGAGFPMATKMRAVASGRGRPVVVVNGAESEPASGKDRLLLTMRPHLVLDGALVAAAAVGAGSITVCADDDDVLASLERAIAVGRASEPSPLPVELVRLPRRYVAGEERSIVHLLNGGPAIPTSAPPRPFERGVRGRPTLIQNAETLAHLAQVFAFGDGWFRELGTAREPGTRLVTVSGAVAHPGVHEVPSGMPIADLYRSAGGERGGTAGVLIGGYFGSWLTPAQAFDARLSDRSLGRFGAGLGAGVVFFLPEGACGLIETARIATWLAGQSADQCGPCVHGLRAIATTVGALARGGGQDAAAKILRWSADVEGRGACKLPDGAVRFVRSALGAFSGDIEVHRRHGRCGAPSDQALLPTYVAASRAR